MNIWVPRTKIIEPEIVLPGCHVAGRFRITGRLDDGRERVLQDWTPNLITNGGLERWGTGAILTNCSVGGSSTPPTEFDSALGAFLRQHSSINSEIGSCQTTPPYFSWRRKNFVFNPPGANLAIAEIGVGWGTNGTNLWSRSLTKDSGGNPLVLSWLSNETLTVTYEARSYPWLDDVPHSTVISGVTYTGIVRPAFIATSSVYRFWDGAQWAAYDSPAGGIGLTVYTGGIGAITGAPSGSNASSNVYNTGNAAYVAGSLQATGNGGFLPSQANLAGGIGSLMVRPSTVPWQVSFTPTIAKLNTHTLNFNVTSGVWGRKP